MYKIEHPVYCIAEVVNRYSNRYTDTYEFDLDSKRIFKSKESLIQFLAKYTFKEICETKFTYVNKYIDGQVFNKTDDGKYICWINMSGFPFFDLRLLWDDVIKEYNKPKKEYRRYIWHPRRRPKSHTTYNIYGNLHYVQRKRAATSLLYEDDEEFKYEYKRLAKPKDLYYDAWMNEELFETGKRRSSGWKNNKNRYQWEAKAKRLEGKVKKQNPNG